MVSVFTRKLIRQLLSLKMQVISIALVVATGFAVFIGAMTNYQSLSSAQTDFYNKQHFATLFVNLKQAPVSLLARIKTLKGVSAINASIHKTVKLLIKDMDEPASGLFISIDKHQKINKPFVLKGRLPESHLLDEILVSNAFAKANQLKPGDKITGVLNGKVQTFTITGIGISPAYIYSVSGTSIVPDDKHFGVFWLNKKALEAAFNMTGGFNHLTLLLDSDTKATKLITPLDKLLAPYGSLGAFTRDNQLSHRLLTNEFKQLKWMALVLPSIFLGITCFLLNRVITRLIQLQRREIANLKALGFTSSQLVNYYLKVIGLIVLLGGLIGTALGIWMGQSMLNLYREFFTFPSLPYLFSWQHPLFCLAITFIAAALGLSSGLYGVFKLPVAQAMRPVTPKAYHRGKLDKLLLAFKLSPVTNMTMRNMTRAPSRQILSIIGISCGVAIVVLGLFWRDAMNYLLDIQFNHIEKAHLQVSFNQAVSKKALKQLKQMPGVLLVEAYHTLAVRLSSRQHHYQTALIGLPKDSRLKQLQTATGQKISLLQNQLAISQSLANTLKVNRGSQVWVEALTGKKRATTLTITHIVDDYLGLQAYIDYQSLHRLFDEPRSITDVALTIDPNYERLVYQRLKIMPSVSAVSVKARMIALFEETFAKHLLVFTAFLTGFAMIIAFGIIYNNAAIALSERSLELSTLRVLGMNEQEVSLMLLIEQVVQLVLGILLGFALALLLAKLSIATIPADIIRIPLVIHPPTYLIGALTVIMAAFLTGLVIFKRIKALNLTALRQYMD